MTQNEKSKSTFHACNVLIHLRKISGWKFVRLKVNIYLKYNLTFLA